MKKTNVKSTMYAFVNNKVLDGHLSRANEAYMAKEQHDLDHRFAFNICERDYGSAEDSSSFTISRYTGSTKYAVATSMLGAVKPEPLARLTFRQAVQFGATTQDILKSLGTFNSRDELKNYIKLTIR